MRTSRTRNRERVEDSACRHVLRWAGISPAQVCSNHIGTKLTFRMLRESHDFPGHPVVSGAAVGTPFAMLNDAERSSLWADWWFLSHENGDDRHQVVIASTPAWSFVAVDRNDNHACIVPHAVIGRGEIQLRIRLIDDWLASLAWTWERPADRE